MPARPVRCDVGLQVGEGQDQVGLEARIFGVSAEVNAQTRGSQPHLGRTYGVARDADDAILLAQQIKRLDRLLGEADEAARRKMTHADDMRNNGTLVTRAVSGSCK